MTNTPKFLVIHHTASARDTTTVEAVNEFHRTKDWDTGPAVAKAPKSSLGFYVQYHYFIEANGKVTKCAEENEIRWHGGPDANTVSIAVCLAGWFDDGHDDMPTKAQADALAKLGKDILKRYGMPLSAVYGHRHFMNKTCPGKHVTDVWIKGLLGGSGVQVDMDFATKYNGRIIVDVDDHGRKWYVYDGRRYEIDKAPEFEKLLGTATFAVWMKAGDLARIPLG